MELKITFICCFLILKSVVGEFVCPNPTEYIGRGGIDEPGYRCSGGAGECVALVKKCVPSVGQPELWRKGRKVQDNCDNIPYGTLIATFCGADNKYDGKKGHAAIFVGCEGGQVQVIDQWCGQNPKKPSQRPLRPNRGGPRDCSNNANEFYTIKHEAKQQQQQQNPLQSAFAKLSQALSSATEN